jgi:hypothetical protein
MKKKGEAHSQLRNTIIQPTVHKFVSGIDFIIEDVRFI